HQYCYSEQEKASCHYIQSGQYALFRSWHCFYFIVLTIIFWGGVSEGSRPFASTFFNMVDSSFSPCISERTSTYSLRSSFTSSFRAAILWTLPSALWELAIITVAKKETKMINNQFLGASPLTKNLPFNRSINPFLTTLYP